MAGRLYLHLSRDFNKKYTKKRLLVKRLLLLVCFISSRGFSATHREVFNTINFPCIEAEVRRIFESSPLHFVLEDLMTEYEQTRGKLDQVNQLIYCIGEAEAESEALIRCDREYQAKVAADDAARTNAPQEQTTP